MWEGALDFFELEEVPGFRLFSQQGGSNGRRTRRSKCTAEIQSVSGLTDMTAFGRVQLAYDPTRPLYTPVHRFPLQKQRSSVTGCTLSRDSARESAAILNNPSYFKTRVIERRGGLRLLGC